MIRDPKTTDDIKANREEWAQALESGKYLQGKYALRNNDAFCCWGVLCDLIDPSQWNISPITGQSKWQENTRMPPDDVIKSVGIKPSNINTPVSTFDSIRFAHENDNGAPFAKIAQVIRKTPLPKEVPS